MDDKNVALLVCSCDRYKDAWLPCAKSIEKFWPDCIGEKILLSETQNADDICFFDRTLNVNESQWTTRLNRALDKIDQEYVIFMLEDQWPTQRVNQDVIAEAYEYIKDNTDIGAIYFETSIEGGAKEIVRISENYNEIPFGAPYRLSCAPGIFRKTFLERITIIPESAWEFERIRSMDEIGKAYRVLEINGVNWARLDGPGAIARGKWIRKMVNYAKEIDFDVNHSQREIVSLGDEFIGKLKSCIFNINPRLIVKIQNYLYSKRK